LLLLHHLHLWIHTHLHAHGLRRSHHRLRHCWHSRGRRWRNRDSRSRLLHHLGLTHHDWWLMNWHDRGHHWLHRGNSDRIHWHGWCHHRRTEMHGLHLQHLLLLHSGHVECILMMNHRSILLELSGSDKRCLSLLYRQISCSGSLIVLTECLSSSLIFSLLHLCLNSFLFIIIGTLKLITK
jgi:hypothetical protein